MTLLLVLTCLFSPIAMKTDTAPQSRELPHIEIVLSAGKLVQLTDNTLWEIAPEDRKTAETWLVPHAMIITHTGIGQYPYLLTAKDTGQSVAATPVHQSIDELKVSPSFKKEEAKKKTYPQFKSKQPEKKVEKAPKKEEENDPDTSTNK